MSNNPSPLLTPWSPRTLLRVSWIIIILVSFAAGYSYLLYKTENLKYRRLEDRYVRVRDQIGRQAMQDLIDASYQ